MLKGGLPEFLCDWLFYTLVVFSGVLGVLGLYQGELMRSVALLGAAALFFSIGHEKQKRRELWAVVSAFVLLVFGLLGVTPPNV